MKSSIIVAAMSALLVSGVAKAGKLRALATAGRTLSAHAQRVNALSPCH